VLYPELAPGFIVERSGGYFNSAPGANQTHPNVEGRLRIESGTRILRVISRARRRCHLLLIRLWGLLYGVWSDFEYYRVTGLCKKNNKYGPMTLHDTRWQRPRSKCKPLFIGSIPIAASTT